MVNPTGLVPYINQGPPVSLLGLAYRYHLDEPAGNAIDSGPAPFDLNAVNAPGTAPGVVLTCRTYSGLQEHSKLLNTVGLLASHGGVGTDYSVSCFFKRTALGTAGMVAGVRQDVTPQLHWFIDSDFDDKVYLFVGDGTGAFQFLQVSPGVIAIDTWYAIAFSYNRTTKEVRFRFNGGAASPWPTVVPSPAGTPANNLDLLIGGDTGERIVGNVDEVFGWNRLLTDDELLGLSFPNNPVYSAP